MSSPELDVKYVANLARLDLSPEEVETFQGQLGDILQYIAKLGDLDVSDIEPTAHANPVYDVMREDVSRPGFGVENALLNAPAKAKDEILIGTRVVE